MGFPCFASSLCSKISSSEFFAKFTRLFSLPRMTFWLFIAKFGKKEMLVLPSMTHLVFKVLHFHFTFSLCKHNWCQATLFVSSVCIQTMESFAQTKPYCEFGFWVKTLGSPHALYAACFYFHISFSLRLLVCIFSKFLKWSFIV